MSRTSSAPKSSSRESSAEDKKQIRADFRDAVNMAPAELRSWLKTDDSRSVGWASGEAKHKAGGQESVGHKSGRRIVAIKCKKAADLTDADFDHMKKVVGYVRRHLAQKPGGDIEDSRWRRSLMNWGHDPLKD
jgi:hypothetical protein